MGSGLQELADVARRISEPARRMRTAREEEHRLAEVIRDDAEMAARNVAFLATDAFDARQGCIGADRQPSTGAGAS